MPSAHFLKMMELDEQRRAAKSAQPVKQETAPMKPKKPASTKTQATQPVEPVSAPAGRGRPASGKARQPVTVRLDADLVEIMTANPDWREQINAILREHYLAKSP